MLCGDSSDNIKGVRGIGEKTLFTNFPEIRTRKVTLQEVIKKAADINEARASEKKKPLVWANNIVNGVTDGAQGDKLYEINRKIIDLSDPLMTKESKELLDTMMHQPMDPEGRTFANLYKIVCDIGIDEWRDEGHFSNFFNDFNKIVNNEKKFFEKFGKEIKT